MDLVWPLYGFSSTELRLLDDLLKSKTISIFNEYTIHRFDK